MAVFVLILAFCGFGIFVWGLSFVRRRRAWQRPPGPVRCRCGYLMEQLDTVRCPECGRVSGFDATAEELELTDEQLRLAKAKRDARIAESARAAETHA